MVMDMERVHALRLLKWFPVHSGFRLLGGRVDGCVAVSCIVRWGHCESELPVSSGSCGEWDERRLRSPSF